MMDLYLLRHGPAEDPQAWAPRKDANRPLTDLGRKKVKRIAKALRRLDLDLDWVLTSPYRRAYDTAQIVAHTLKIGKNMRVLKTLASDGDPQQLLKHLALDYRSGDSVLLVGHEPYLTRLVSVLIGSSERLSIDLKKAGLFKLTADSLTYGPCATFQWLLPPKILQQL